jgi:hypothetical protein
VDHPAKPQTTSTTHAKAIEQTDGPATTANARLVTSTTASGSSTEPRHHDRADDRAQPEASEQDVAARAECIS